MSVFLTSDQPGSLATDVQRLGVQAIWVEPGCSQAVDAASQATGLPVYSQPLHHGRPQAPAWQQKELADQAQREDRHPPLVPETSIVVSGILFLSTKDFREKRTSVKGVETLYLQKMY